MSQTQPSSFSLSDYKSRTVATEPIIRPLCQLSDGCALNCSTFFWTREIKLMRPPRRCFRPLSCSQRHEITASRDFKALNYHFLKLLFYYGSLKVAGRSSTRWKYQHDKNVPFSVAGCSRYRRSGRVWTDRGFRMDVAETDTMASVVSIWSRTWF